MGLSSPPKTVVGQLYGGLFVSFWFTLYLQFTKEQVSIRLQSVRSPVGFSVCLSSCPECSGLLSGIFLFLPHISSCGITR